MTIQQINNKLVQCWLVLCLLVFNSSYAQQSKGFSGGVTPARFELSSKPGKIIRKTLTIYNFGNRKEEYKIQTNDWQFSVTGALSFDQKLAKNSCRRWVKLERHVVQILPGKLSARPFRFEVHIPVDVKPQECRFAIMVESLAEPFDNKIAGGAVSLPTVGKIAVIVYLNIGKVKPDLVINSIKTKQINGFVTPVFKIRNNGKAHDRLSSEIVAIDAIGKKIPVSIATSPILPGQTRDMVLNFETEYLQNNKKISYPLQIKGKLYSKHKIFKIEQLINGE